MIVSSCFGRWPLSLAIAAACVIGTAGAAGAQTSGPQPRIGQDLPERFSVQAPAWSGERAWRVAHAEREFGLVRVRAGPVDD